MKLKLKSLLKSIKTKIRQKINQLRFGLYCDLDIKAKYFFTSLEKNDLRYLVIGRHCDYPNDKLVAAWEQIYSDYQKLTGNNKYYESLTNTVNDIKKNNKLNSLIIGYYLLKLRRKEAFEPLKIFGIDINEITDENINSVKLRLDQELTKHRIRNAKKEQAKQGPEERMSWDALKWTISINSEITIDDNITLKSFCYLLKSIEEKNKKTQEYINKIGKNG